MSMSRKPFLFTSALLYAAAAAGCGDPPIDQDQQAATQAGADVSAAVELSIAGLLPLSEVDFSRPPSRDAVNAAVTAINDIPGDCVVASAAVEPAIGMGLAFNGGSFICGLLPVKGAVSVAITQGQGTSGSRLDASFGMLEVPPVALDGSIAFTKTQSAFAYDFNQLHVAYDDHDVTLDGAGTYTRSFDRTSVTFDGVGSIQKGGETFHFTASKVHRSLLNDCYPSSGSITLSFDSKRVSKTVTVTIRFDDPLIGGLDSGDSGKVYLDYDGHTTEYQLPKRGTCG